MSNINKINVEGIDYDIQDKSVPDWAKQPSKPDYNYDEIKETPSIPTKVSDLENDKGFITNYAETDPTVPTHVKGITEENITNWNNKQEKLIPGENITIENNIISALNSGGGIIELTGTSVKITSLESGIYKAPQGFAFQPLNSNSTSARTIETDYGFAIIQKHNTYTYFTIFEGNTSGHQRISTGYTNGTTVENSFMLTTKNTTTYAPTHDYTPAPKIYVDTAIANIAVPTKVSELENDSGFITTIPSQYITETEMNTAIASAITGALEGSY